MLIDIIQAQDSRRKQAEAMIHARFQDAYDANVHHYMPQLLRLRSRDNCEDIAMLGFRPASIEPLFLEHYLDQPIELVIATHVGHAVARDEVVEVGNLADFRSGGARAAIVAATAFLYGSGYRWVAFTGVPLLYNAFYRLGLEPIIIAEASANRLQEAEQDEWGHYYDNTPKVMFGNIHEGQEALEYSRKVLLPLWEHAVQQGRNGGLTATI
ncbi:MAG: thermostable hemolysin [Mariprofundaceae bacterium]|nr:thermostable hemolysin [Mariprofundaceae bacterium]